MNQPHYLRFARALTLAALVPAPLVPGCTSATPEPAPITASDAGVSAADATTTVADASAPMDEVDAHAFSSGPIVPPELPAELAAQPPVGLA